MAPFCCCCNCAIVAHIVMQIFNLVVLSVITAPHNVSTVSVKVRELKLIDAQKTSQGKRQTFPMRVGGSPTALTNLKVY